MSQCLGIRINRKLKANDVIDALSDLFILRGIPTHIPSDNGPEFIAQNLHNWLAAVGVKTAYIMPGSPWTMAIVRASTRSCEMSF
jgi:transposase InsO family protein